MTALKARNQCGLAKSCISSDETIFLSDSHTKTSTYFQSHISSLYVAQLLHLPAEPWFLDGEAAQLTDHRAWLGANVVAEDTAKHVQAEAPATE